MSDEKYINCIITPTKQFTDTLVRTYNSILCQTIKKWKWIIINDTGHQPIQNNNITKLINKDFRIEVINNTYERGAGFARNCALDLIQKNYKECNLFFIDSGDEWNPFFLEKSISALKKNNINIVSYSYLIQWKNGRKKEIVKSGTKYYNDMLVDYSTSCLSTSLKIDDTSVFSQIRFGETKRANDQPFFLSAVKYYGSVKLIKDVLGIYHLDDPKSLSRIKIFSAISKWKVLKNQNLPFLLRCSYFARYAINGFRKYFF